MNYRITCVCGHQFQVSDDQVRGELECPVCRQRLKPAVEAPPPAFSSPPPPAPPPPAPVPYSPPPHSASAETPEVSPSEPAPSAASQGRQSPDATAAPAAPPVSAAAPAPTAARAVPAIVEATKRCPFCGEVILAIARKCKHCGEFLDRAAPDPAASHSPGISQGTAAAALAPNAAGPAPTAQSQHDPVFNLNSSQWDNFWRFVIIGASFFFIAVILALVASPAVFFVGALGALVIGGFVAWFFYLRTKSTHIRIYPFRIDVESGILSKNLESLELFRITDTEFKQSLIERIVGIGTINLMTGDNSSEPELTIFQIPHAREVLKYLQTQIPFAARQRGAVYLEK